MTLHLVSIMARKGLLATNPVHVVINSVCKRDAWSSADWDGTFYEGDKITGPSKIDPQAYVHHDELTVWTPHFYHSFEFGGTPDDPLFEPCIQRDCHNRHVMRLRLKSRINLISSLSSSTS